MKSVLPHYRRGQLQFTRLYYGVKANLDWPVFCLAALSSGFYQTQDKPILHVPGAASYNELYLYSYTIYEKAISSE